jgi:hypothetical protein
VVDL